MCSVIDALLLIINFEVCAAVTFTPVDNSTGSAVKLHYCPNRVQDVVAAVKAEYEARAQLLTARKASGTAVPASCPPPSSPSGLEPRNAAELPPSMPAASVSNPAIYFLLAFPFELLVLIGTLPARHCPCLHVHTLTVASDCLGTFTSTTPTQPAECFSLLRVS